MKQRHNPDEALLEALYTAVGEADAGELVSGSMLRERREEAVREEQASE